MHIIARDNNVEQALRALKKKLQREGVYREMKLRRHYEKPSEKRAASAAPRPPGRHSASASRPSAKAPPPASPSKPACQEGRSQCPSAPLPIPRRAAAPASCG